MGGVLGGERGRKNWSEGRLEGDAVFVAAAQIQDAGLLVGRGCWRGSWRGGGGVCRRLDGRLRLGFSRTGLGRRRRWRKLRICNNLKEFRDGHRLRTPVPRAEQDETARRDGHEVDDCTDQRAGFIHECLRQTAATIVDLGASVKLGVGPLCARS